MKIITLALTLALVGCNSSRAAESPPAPATVATVQPPAAAPTPPSPNFVVDLVLAVDPDAKCDRVYTDEGPTHVHSARCRMSTKAIIYASISTDKGFVPQPLNGPAPEQHASAPAAPPAPPASEPRK